MRLHACLTFVGILAVVGCGDDTGGSGTGGAGTGGAGTGGAAASTTTTTAETTAAATTTGGEGGSGDGGSGVGGSGVGGGEACEENVPECLGCGPWSEDPDAGFEELCICNGPPSSSDFFNDMVGCLCESCADLCEATCTGGSPPEGECATCFEDSCGTEIEACFSDT